MKMHINECRIRRGLTWRELSERTGFSHAQLIRLQNGRTKSVKLSDLDVLCTVLGCKSLDELMTPEIAITPVQRADDD